MKLLPFRDQLLVTSRVLLQVGQELIPLLLEGRTLLYPLHHLKQQGETSYIQDSSCFLNQSCLDRTLFNISQGFVNVRSLIPALWHYGDPPAADPSCGQSPFSHAALIVER